jgi:GrpB-like predicted nucleotidyltransferase (UPF0157 family)
MIEIVTYKSTWPSEFQDLASRLRGSLGDLALRIDHIGSTAVPGLAAKDVIDIQITVAGLSQSVLSAMLALGYSQPEGIYDHQPPGMTMPDTEWEKWFFRAPVGQRRTNTHVRVQARANWRYALLFRDFLRTHPSTAQAYAELKRQLAQHLANPDLYPDVKDPAVDLIYFAAEDWATAVDWKPGQPDA